MAASQTQGEESLSDESSTSEGDSPTASPNHADMGRISRGQLFAALLLAGRTHTAMELPSIANDAGSPSATTSTATETPTTPSTSSASTAPPPARISNSIFSNALSQALTPMDSTSATEPLDNAQRAQQYASEMSTMYEMGLTDAATNLQALIIFNGSVQEAVNLVLSGMSDFS